MKIPKEFKIANNKYSIEIVDSVKDSKGEEIFGDHNAITNTIRIAKTIDGIKLSEEQMLNTFWHELFHAFQFFFNNDQWEAQAQCYANFMREYQDSVIYN